MTGARPVLRRIRRPIVAAVLGAITVGGFAPFGIFPLPVLTLALLFRLWRGAAPRHTALLGFAWGLGFFLSGVSWVYVSLHDVGGMALPLAALATLLFCAYLALFPALAGWVWARWQGHGPWHDAVLAAGAWTLSEWLRGWLLTGFPWLSVGYSQAPPSPLAGFAPLLGSYGVGLALTALAALIAFAGRRRAIWLAAGAIVVTGALLRNVIWTEPAGPELSISLLQGNVPQSLKWDPQRLSLSLDTYAALARQHPADLVVLPETAIPLLFDQIPRDYLRLLAGRGDLLIGAAFAYRDGRYGNGALAIDAAGSLQSYAKSHLVPFGEFVPPGFAWFFDLVRIPMSDFEPGAAHQAPLLIRGQRIAPDICYEDLFGEEIIRMLPRANLMINLSNTAWFGHSLAQPQHFQIARMRAVETGRPMLRSTNTGITGAILPDGRVLARLPAFTAGGLTVKLRGYVGETPFVRWGNAPALLLALLLSGIGATGRRGASGGDTR